MSYLDPYRDAEPRSREVPESRFGYETESRYDNHSGYDTGSGYEVRTGPHRKPESGPGYEPASTYWPEETTPTASARGGGMSAAPTDPVGWPPVILDRTAEAGPRTDPQAGTGRYPDAGSAPEQGRFSEPDAYVGASEPASAGDPGDEAGPAYQDPPRRRGPGRRRAGRTGNRAVPGASGKPPGRAGRDLPAAIAVGLGLGVLILVPLFLYPPAFLLVVVAAAGVGVWELTRAVGHLGAHPPLLPLLAGTLLMVGMAWWAGPDALSLALLVTVLATIVWRLGDGPRGFQRDLTGAALIAVYVPFLGSFAALLIAEPDDGHLRVLVTLVAVVLSDIGGYAAGVALGRHPMAPSVSPKKSWEGFGGSVLAAAAGSAVLLWWLFDVAPGWGACFGVAVSVAAVLGDLAESMIKRDLGVKDMSNLLPGHGGMMDRLDSILFAMPTAYLLLTLIVPSG